MGTLDIPSEVPQKTYHVTKRPYEKEDGPSHVYVVSRQFNGTEIEFGTVDPDGALAFPGLEGHKWVSGKAPVKLASLMLFDSFGMEVAFEYCGPVGYKMFGFEISPFTNQFEVHTSDLLALVLEVRIERQQSAAGPQGAQGPIDYQGFTGPQNIQGAQSPVGFVRMAPGGPFQVHPQYMGKTAGWAAAQGIPGLVDTAQIKVGWFKKTITKVKEVFNTLLWGWCE